MINQLFNLTEKNKGEIIIEQIQKGKGLLMVEEMEREAKLKYNKFTQLAGEKWSAEKTCYALRDLSGNIISVDHNNEYYNLEYEQDKLKQNNNFYKFNNSKPEDFECMRIYLLENGKPNYNVIPSLKVINENIIMLMKSFNLIRLSYIDEEKNTIKNELDILIKKQKSLQRQELNIRSNYLYTPNKTRKIIDLEYKLFNTRYTQYTKIFKDTEKRFKNMVKLKNFKIHFKKKIMQMEYSIQFDQKKIDADKAASDEMRVKTNNRETKIYNIEKQIKIRREKIKNISQASNFDITKELRFELDEIEKLKNELEIVKNEDLINF